MSLFRKIGRRVERFKQDIEAAAEDQNPAECEACGAALDPEQQTCPECGAAVVEAEPDAA